MNRIDVDWHQLNQTYRGLNIGTEHEIVVQREAIPLVFVPGIMGSVLRRKGTTGEGDGPDGLPNMRWNVSSMAWMWWQYSGSNAVFRRNMLVGPGSFNSNFLEVHNTNPVGNGFQGVAKGSYHSFLKFLQDSSNLDPLTKIFEFPVFAFGYNWTDTNMNNGKLLADRIKEIIIEAKEVTGVCEKVILITHSMGGLVSRSALQQGAAADVLGVIHGVQPAVGSAAAYWRVKAGFEAEHLLAAIASRVLGNSARTVTPVLGSIPGGLELLPNQDYTDNQGRKQWLIVKEDDKEILALPKADPYKEIYRIKATGNEVKNPGRKYWALIDPELLDASMPAPKDASPVNPDNIAKRKTLSGWDHYIAQLDKAEKFNRWLSTDPQDFTFTFSGIGSKSADRVVMETESVWVEWDPYPKRGFRGRYNNTEGKKRRALIQYPTGNGDGTVPISSATFLDKKARKNPAPAAVKAEHEPAYNDSDATKFVRAAIVALCTERYRQKTGITIIKL